MPSALAVALTPASDAQAPTWLRRDWREVEADVQHSPQSRLESPFVATWPATRTSRAIGAAMRLIVLAICITACAVRAQVRAAQTVAWLVAAWLALAAAICERSCFSALTRAGRVRPRLPPLRICRACGDRETWSLFFAAQGFARWAGPWQQRSSMAGPSGCLRRRPGPHDHALGSACS